MGLGLRETHPRQGDFGGHPGPGHGAPALCNGIPVTSPGAQRRRTESHLMDSRSQSLQSFYDLRGELGSSHRLFNLDTNILNENADKPFAFGFFYLFFQTKKE